jgi:hypothetical protein
MEAVCRSEMSALQPTSSSQSRININMRNNMNFLFPFFIISFPHFIFPLFSPSLLPSSYLVPSSSVSFSPLVFPSSLPTLLSPLLQIFNHSSSSVLLWYQVICHRFIQMHFVNIFVARRRNCILNRPSEFLQ